MCLGKFSVTDVWIKDNTGEIDGCIRQLTSERPDVAGTVEREAVVG